MAGNPFRVGGVVAGEYFTDRAAEVRRIAAALAEPQARLLVYGPRRMGKTSAIQAALARVRRRGAALAVDLSAATTTADVATRIVQAAVRELGRDRRQLLAELVTRIRAEVTLGVDPASGLPTVTFGVGHRSDERAAQRASLAAALDAVDALAARRRRTIGVVLDEFQQLHRLDGQEAEWHLRSVIQRHEHVAYVLAGSEEALIGEMLEKGRAFYGLLEVLRIGPIDREHLSRWIEARLRGAAVRPGAGVGESCLALAGPRTRDVVQLARATYELTRAAGAADAGAVGQALDSVVDQQEELFQAQWEALTALQQNVLRAAAAGEERLFSGAVRERFSLGESAATAAAVRALLQRGLIEKRESGRYAPDSPFFRRWIERMALPDVGLGGR
jgi:uncharacterized protein